MRETVTANEPVDSPHARSVDELLEMLDASVHGLDQNEVQRRRLEYGLNTLPQPPKPGIMAIFIRQFFSPLIYVLLFAALVSLSLGHYLDAIFIAAVLLINATIGTVQEHSAEKSAKALRSMVRTVANVLREGEPLELDSEELLPGDIVFLGSGNRVPADIRLISAKGVEVDESLLTGESLAVAKSSEGAYALDSAVGDRLNMLFSGSIIVRGRCHGLVVATGEQTEIGKIAGSLSATESAKPPLLLRMEDFTRVIALVFGVIALLLIVVELVLGAPFQEVFLLAVALAVSVIPEGLPVAITVALAIGANRMAKRNVVVRRLYAVEALGSCTFIASDKTGTLTVNEMAVAMVALPGGELLRIDGRENLQDHLPVSQQQQLGALARSVALNNEAYLGMRNGKWVHHGDAVDVALQIFAYRAGVIRQDAMSEYPLVEDIPFESENRFSASLHQHGDRELVFVKGALEALLPMCAGMALADGKMEIDEKVVLAQSEQLAREGYRILAVAGGVRQIADGSPFTVMDLEGLTFLGLVGMIDPLRQEVKGAIESCRHAGIDVSMVTGDHPVTALAIARELGMAESEQQVVTGYQLRQAEEDGEAAVDRLTRDTRVFARVDPSQKVVITRSLIRNGHFIAMTGDGANDAPALNAANVGVSMGVQGTDVARESSDMILVDDNFTSIVSGIEEGRVAYANVRKVIFLLISTGAAEVVLFFLALMAGVALPLLPAQLLWLNLVTNGIQDVALAFEPAEGDEMRRPPRSPEEPIFNRLMVERIIVSSLMMGVTAFILYWNLTHVLGMDIDAARNSTLLLMVLFENVHVFNCRSESRSIFQLSPLRNPLLLFGTVLAQLIHIGAMYVPWLQRVLGVQPISFEHWLQLLGIALLLMVVMEIQKKINRHHPGNGPLLAAG
ncbi:MAG: HAD-IC family P-type ATPase [Gammaproteobacteria bacterium]|uniref:HAD-IC family P-type ATPase n=1 Tax=Candidatus Thiopontia autotrophica TaxID=2841688 RepID=A0A8J6NYZ5_9GAMM|nr:HAD-IC family P-type ATPase [Candidatus Thiopontia autotrophica]MBL6968809.1 HAD-IC family P-type ATPase [Gammaproteobacteria bacterium]